MYKSLIFMCIFIATCLGCAKSKPETINTNYKYLEHSLNILDYYITPKDKFDKDGLMFSDQGAWFAYAFPDSTAQNLGFTGPFLMTQQNGIWTSPILSSFNLQSDSTFSLNRSNNIAHQKAFPSHLEQKRVGNNFELTEKLTFLSGNTALIKYSIKNISSGPKKTSYGWSVNKILADGLSFEVQNNVLEINSKKSSAKGYIILPENNNWVKIDSSIFTLQEKYIELKPNETRSFTISQTFIFPEHSWEQEKVLIESIDFDSIVHKRKQEKHSQLKALIEHRKPQFQDDKYAEVLAKAHLTLQNNWRIPAGEIKHEGLFPSYHYKWFNGFWSWDSWKHAVGLSHYDLRLAKEQVKLMFDFQNDDGFVADVVYRDTTIEAHNYRDTKPPLAGWAVHKIYYKDRDTSFLNYMYPKLKKYHYWWYNKRDHDKDGVCEYGSTDGSLIAAKWESGMDNAIRFDNSKIVLNGENAFSLDQESVDLNAYLFAEKIFLAELAKELNQAKDHEQYLKEAKLLKEIIQTQFYDSEDGWFYDTSLDGSTFIKGEGSEGWTALWAEAATPEQAIAVKTKMMDPNKFYTKVPFQTMSADHEKFDPLKGYWRGPNWLDQAYFGVKGLRNYGFNEEADLATIKILEGAKGLLGKGKAIRENYHPLTGEGLHAHNFSWSAAHIIMLLVENK